MTQEIWIEIIKVIPSILLYLLLFIVFVRLRKPLVDGLLNKVTTFKAFGIEANFVKTGIEKAMGSINRTDIQVSAGLLRRIDNYKPRPVRILWVDDRPDSIVYEAGILNRLNMEVEFVKSDATALEKLRAKPFDLILSDISRNGQAIGVEWMQQMRKENFRQPFIFYVGHLDRSLGIPVGAFGITDDPNELFHLVLDAAERMDGKAD